MRLKILLVLCLIAVFMNYCVFAEEDITQNAEYQDVMNKVRDRNSKIQINNPVRNKEKTQGLVVSPTQVQQSKFQSEFKYNIDSIVEYDNHKDELYNDIISKYNAINSDMDNLLLYTEFIKSVEAFLNNYSDTTLKFENVNNYSFILERLGYAYEKTSNINNAIVVYKTLLNERPTDLNIKKRLLYLYDSTQSCTNAINILEQIQINEPDFKTSLVNCTPKHPVDVKRYNNDSTLLKLPPVKDYDWNDVYGIYFGFWVLILILSSFDMDKYINDNTVMNDYKLKYNSTNSVIKPEMYEFGLTPDLFKQVQQKLNSIEKFDIKAFFIAPLSMFLITDILSAPNIILPIFTKGSGILWGVLFWIISANIINTLKDKFIILLNIRNIRNYNIYQCAIKKYANELAKIEKIKLQVYEREQRKKFEYWSNLEPSKFEEQMGELFKNLGYSVTVTQKSRDGGIDILIKKGNIIKGVQCKHYKSKVGAKEIRELWGVKDYFKLNNKVIRLNGVILVAFSGVTQNGYEFIRQFPDYELWTIDTILEKSQSVNEF